MRKLFYIIILTGLLGCDSDEIDSDNIKLPNLNADYLLPLGNVTYRLDSLIEKAGDSALTLVVDPRTSLISFFYSYAINYGPEDYVAIIESGKDTQVIKDLRSDQNGNITFQGGLPVFDYNTTREGKQIDSIFYSKGFVLPTVTSTKPITYTLTVNNLLRISDNTPAAFSGTSGSVNSPLDLTGYKTILSTAKGNNSFNVDFDATLLNVSNVTQQDSIIITIEYYEQDFSILYGKLGQDTIDVDSIVLELDFFQNIESDGLTFRDPIVRLDFENDFGIPFGMTFASIFGDNGEGSKPIFLNGSITESLQELNGSEIPGVAAFDTVTIDKTNSNIVNVLAQSPSRFVLDINAISNPIENPLKNNYIRQGDEIKGVANIIIPLEVDLRDVEVIDTIRANEDLDVSDVDSAYFKVMIENGLPFAGLLSIEIVLQDTTDNDPYIATDKMVLESALVDENGVVTQPRSTTENVPIGEKGIQKLEKSALIISRLLLNTSGSSNDRFIPLSADYELKIVIGLGVRVDIEL